MKVKEIVEKYHTTRKALLVYEDKGFIHPTRDESGYRIYHQDDIEIIKKILLLRKLEFSLEEIEEILIYQNYALFDDKKEEYNKEIHFIETKGDYLDYVHQVLEGEYDIDEAIEVVDETLQLYENNQYNDKVYFKYNRDTIGIVWLGSLLIAFLSQQVYLIVLSLLLGLLSIVLSLQSFRKKIMSLPKEALYMSGCVIGFFIWIIFIFYPDNFQNCMIGTMGLDIAFFSFSYLKHVKNFFLRFSKWLSFLLFGCGIAMLIWICEANVEGVLGMSLAQLSILYIVLGMIYNPFIRNFLLAILNIY